MRLINRTEAGQRRVYDIEVEGVHNFYANGVNVHNCATDGGVSVIKDDGSVVDIDTVSPIPYVDFTANNKLCLGRKFSDIAYIGLIPSVNINGVTWRSLSTTTYIGSGGDLLVPNDDVSALSAFGSNDVAIGYEKDNDAKVGLVLVNTDDASPSLGMIAYLTSTYNTGWMNGDIKLAALSDTDDTDLVESGELITNGEDWTGASGNTPPNGWIKAGNLTQYTITQDGALEIDRNGDGSGDTRQTFSTVEGKKYILSFDIISTGGGSILINVTVPAFSSTLISSTGKKFFTFTATSSDARFEVRPTSTNQVIEIDNVSVKLADEDRSVNNNGLIINGTITRTFVDEV